MLRISRRGIGVNEDIFSLFLSNSCDFWGNLNKNDI